MSLVKTPFLNCEFVEPLHDLERYLLQKQSNIEYWIRQQLRLTPPPFYCSVDLRNAGFKLAPVDTNLFPAGFNNLNSNFTPLAIQAVQSTLEKYYPGYSQILIVPESHTRNLFYLENLKTLQDIILKAGYEVRIGSLIKELDQLQTIKLPSGKDLLLEPLQRKDKKLVLENFVPQLILLNNDLSDEIPAILQDIEQPVMPSPQLGWSKRLKSSHFAHYDTVCKEFAELIGIDSWLINPIFRQCGAVNFLKHEGEKCLMENVSYVLEQIREKYQQYGIKEKPFVMVKADAGTYGMGILTVYDEEELLHLNRKERTRMATSKGQKAITKVIIQEGVYTFETVGKEHAVAEPVVYMLGQHVIGGFYRVHNQRGVTDNLNSPGAHFEPLAFIDCCNNPDYSSHPDCQPNRFYAYGVVARLALLAAARELKDVTQGTK